MPEKNSDEVEEILKLIGFYGERFEKTGSKADRLRYDSLSDKYADIIHSDNKNFYFSRFKKTKSKGDEIRHKFSVMKYYEVLCQRKYNKNNKVSHQRAKENYERFFEIKDVFSPNRKT